MKEIHVVAVLGLKCPKNVKCKNSFQYIFAMK